MVALTVGYQHNCAMDGNGAVKCWGRNDFGQLGNGSVTPFFTGLSNPVSLTGFSSGGAAAVVAGGFHTCAIKSEGTALCWGADNYGQTGDGLIANPVANLTPTAVAGLSAGVAGLGLGQDHTCAVLMSGQLDCWGQNSSGQLGQGTTGGSTATHTTTWAASDNDGDGLPNAWETSGIDSDGDAVVDLTLAGADPNHTW
jgi:alpha-tubulin suppressor-like RCC1 family protein